MAKRRTVLRAAALAPLLSACAPGVLFGHPASVRIAVPWSGSELIAFRRVLADAGLADTVAVLPLGDDIDTALQARGRSAPDLVMLPDIGRIPELAGGTLRALPPTLWADADGPRYRPQWEPLVWKDKALYGIPFKAADKSLLWYDRYAFRGSGPRDDPKEWTVSDWPQRAAAATDRNPFALGAADGWVLADLFGNVLFSESPGDYERLAVDDPRTGPRDWNSDAVRAGMRRLATLWSPRNTFPGGLAATLTSQFPDSVREVFEHRRAAMVVAPDFAEPIVNSCLRRARRSKEAVGVMPFPAVAPGRPRPAIGGGDVIVATASGAHNVEPVIEALTAPGAVAGWISDFGGFLAPGTRTVPDHPPLLEPVAADLHSWTHFDFADLIGAAGRREGLWRALTDLLVTVGDGRGDRTDAAVDQAVRTMQDFERRPR
ncbi:putative multiple sugar ABC transporter, solute-binding protein [Nocardia nova SH22a]|uniref:Putative multiple sugar ABC transporter, solute-binding protein n=1 Tax=Nocardia nova SH22a TaxID=1415166 RepID=W5THV1_9NOCA|nr:ABC transporter substrate-binding protein [Nocardia nova]AHH18900.1 putative multiple sugar ABC transporter, solute-binding protein [Nocardia nova SH22a]